MSIDVGDLVRFNNRYQTTFRRFSKRAKRFFRVKSPVMKVISIDHELLIWNRKRRRMEFNKAVVVDVEDDSIFAKKGDKKRISVDWLAIVKKGPSGVLLRGANSPAKRVASSGADEHCCTLFDMSSD